MVERLTDLRVILCDINLYKYLESPNISPSNDVCRSISLSTIDIINRYAMLSELCNFHIITQITRDKYSHLNKCKFSHQ